ncbi:MAG: translocation/assembly module TamB [Bacteroidetes bacterium SW_9_63_38]|nr:MAG: translocation/assembly module TamB [Bacteroidetes bacterium SW_9_63_38]
MSESSSRPLTRIVWGLLRTGAYLALAGIVVFVALTRTEVGRDQLRQEIQSAFDARFAGSLEIGTLRGTLLNDIQATNVRLRDKTGTLVASIDSVAGTPSWHRLFAAELSVSSLTLVRPHLHLHRQPDGSWNIRDALQRTSPSSSGTPLDLSFLSVVIRNGRITTTRSGPAPSLVQKQWAFDYTQTTVDSISANGSVQWTDDQKRVSLNALQADMPRAKPGLHSAEATLVQRGAKWIVDPLSLELGNTEIGATATIEPVPNRPSQPAVDVTLAPSRLDHDQLRRFVPRLPLRKTVRLKGRVGGTMDRFVVSRLTVAHNRSQIAVEGTAFGLPDSLNLDAQLLESRVHPADVRSVWPGTPLDRLGEVGPITVSASVRGGVAWKNRPAPAFDLESTLSAAGKPGAVRGSLSVQRSPTTPLRYSGRVSMDSLNLAPVTGRERLDGRLTGMVRLDGTGTTASTLDATLDARLSDSRLRARRLALADLQLTAQNETIRGQAVVRQPSGGTLSVEGTVNAQGAAPLYDLTATAKSVNLAGASPTLPPSRLNATMTADGRGRFWNTLTGTAELAVDESTLGTGARTRTLPPHDITLTLRAPSSDAPRLQIGGALASVSIDGPALAPALRRSGRIWQTAVQHTVRAEWQKSTRTLTRPSLPAPSMDSIRTALRDSAAGLPLQLDGEIAIHRMDLLRRWWPGTPVQGDHMRATAQLTIGPDTISANGTLTADSLRAGSRWLDSLHASYHLSAPYRGSLSTALTAALSVQADTLQVGDRVLLRPSATATLVKGSGGLAAQAERYGRTGPFRLASSIRLSDGLTLGIRDLHVGTGPNAWTTTASSSPNRVRLYSDAVVVNDLSLRSPRPRVNSAQHLRVHGALSARQSDTLHVEMTDVLLYPLGKLAAMPRALGGRLNGDIAVTGGWTQPQVQSTLSVDRLSFDRRVLGDLSVQTRLQSGMPDLFIDAALTSGPSSTDALSGPPLVPDGPRVVEGNRLDVQGRVRLPGLAADSAATDPLDLTVDVQRADLFFFEYIFEETLADVRGYTAGTIRIGGRFTKPLFDADMEVREGRFALPKFGLRYGISGPVTVDERGIHLQDVSVTDDGGSATITGSVLFNDYEYFSFDLSGQLDEITIIDVEDAEDLAFYGTIRASGPASLTGPLSDATLRSPEARTTPESKLFIPVSEGDVQDGTGFIVFADSTGKVPNLRDLTQRDNILSDRPVGEPTFLTGLNIDINVIAPEESTVNLVFDPVVGDMVTAVGSGRVQLQREEGDFLVYGDFNVTEGTYLFTAGEVFVRRFNIDEGTITWDGPPINARLDLKADYRTRASPAGLPGYDDNAGRIPVRVLLDIGGRVETPQVDLGLALVQDERNRLVGSQALDAVLNQSDRTTEYATSVLLTNTFLLTTESFTGPSGGGGDTSGNLNTAGQKLAFNSVSQLVASQLNRYLGVALPNVDLNFGVQGETPNDLDLIYGVALRLLNERLVIRGEGVYTGDDPSNRQAPGPQGEFVVEVRLNNRISAEAFYRRSGDELTQGQTLTSSTGAGLSYQSEFSTWRALWERLFGWLFSDDEDSAPDTPAPPSRDPPPSDTTATPVAQRDGRADSVSVPPPSDTD